tara:strand:+ start:384 stop:563 length:180 start_codon:yes stop_codon:yes gene_type:complete
MKTFEVTICAHVTKKITVHATDEDAAAEGAHELFHVLSDSYDEHYEEDTINITYVGEAA